MRKYFTEKKNITYAMLFISIKIQIDNGIKTKVNF